MIDRGIGKNFARALLGCSALVVPALVPVQAASAAAMQAQTAARVKLNIPAQDLGSALSEFARQSNQQLLYSPDLVKGKQSTAVNGAYAPADGLEHLLGNSGVTYSRASSGAFLLSTGAPQGNAPVAVTAASPGEAVSSGGNDVTESEKGIAEILVVGSRSQNVDVKRTEDDSQPYIVFDREDIKNSGAQTLEEFFRKQLTVNGTAASTSTISNEVPTQTGLLNLRGLGTDQTLILVNGRRIASVPTGDSFAQPNINGIPPSAIDRIDVLPSSASGIYGGNATGGVVNIILKRDYSGLDVEAIYGDSFKWDSQYKGINISGGLSSKDARSHAMININISRQEDLLTTQRDFGSKGFEIFSKNDPNSFLLPFVAFGSTPNVISAFGTDLILDPQYGGANLNSPWTHVPADYLGPEQDGAIGLLNNAGELVSTGFPGSLYGAPKTISISADLRHEFSSKLEFYANLYWDDVRRDFNTPQFTTAFIAAEDSPFQDPVLVNLPLWKSGLFSTDTYIAKNYRANLGLTFKLPHRWAGNLDYGLSISRASSDSSFLAGTAPGADAIVAQYAFSDIGAHPIPNIRSLFIFAGVHQALQNTLNDASLRLGGPLLALPGGSVNLTTLLEYRHEQSDNSVATTHFPPFGDSFTWTPEATQTVKSAYGELTVPIVSKSNQMPLVRSLDFSAAVRHESYTSHWAAVSIAVPSPDGPFPDPGFVSSKHTPTDYTLTGRYSPVAGIVFRASFATGFVVPRVSLLKSNPPTTGSASDYFGTTDPRRNNEPLLGDPNSDPIGMITTLTGGNSNLTPETSKSFSTGVIFEPKVFRGLRVSIDYTQIKKLDEIAPSLSAQQILLLEDIFPSRVRRAALTPSDIAVGYTVGRVIYLDRTALNLFKSNVQAIDFKMDYSFAVPRLGNWHLYLAGTHEMQFKKQLDPEITASNAVGLFDGPIAWQGNLGVDWSDKNWSAGWSAQYIDGYSLCRSTETPQSCADGLYVPAQGKERISSQFYQDAYLRYRISDAKSGPLSGVEVTFAVFNLLGKEPPIVALSQSISPQADPRLRRFTLTLSKHLGH